MRVCFHCDGRGWIPNGDIEDGMMTGRAECPRCHGNRLVSADEVLREIQRLANMPWTPVGDSEVLDA